ncbi:hypothetical protein ABZ876_35620 [Streptomyces sp. NPDC046931]|uniref:Ig-like domain-containing protein n=1 Tax=Streptomyces sp. NPDC046931 TaxID=3154806 RepID=UPI00340FD71B
MGGIVLHASGGGGGGGSSFATPSGSGTSYGASPVGTANHDGRVTISYSVVSAITATAGTPQSTPINRFFLVRFQATVTDTVGDPVPGVPVTFTAPPLTGPSGTFDLLDTSVIVFTNANGVATAPTFFANGKVGSYTVTASLADDLSIPPASFALTNTGPTTLAIDKSHDGNFIRGQQGVYTITVGNSPGAAPTDGTTVTVNDTLPTGLTATSISGTGWTCALNTLTCTRSDVLPGGQNYPDITLTVNVSPTAPAQVTNTATITGGGDTTTHTATDPTAITPPGVPSLAIDKSHTGFFVQGQQGVYTITVGNSPGAVPTDGTTVTVNDTLPSGLTATSISGTGWTCALNTLTCTRSDVLPGGQNYPDITLTVDVSPTAPAQVTNTATVTGGGDTTTQTATDPTEIESAPPSLTISKTHTGDFVQGRQGTYTIIVGNNGNGPTDGTTVTMHDILPSGLTAASISGTGWTCTLRTLTCTRSDALPADQNYPDITLTVNVSCRTKYRETAAVMGGDGRDRQVTNTAMVTGGGDPTTETATDPTNINRDKRCGQHHHRRG